MNTSQFMDKQIMDLSASSQTLGSSPKQTVGNDFIDLMNHLQDNDQQSHYSSGSIGENGIKKEEILPSYDFQPIRQIPQNLDATAVLGGTTPDRAWKSTDSKPNSTANPTRSYSSLDSIEPARVIMEKDESAFDAAIVSEIDRTMKKYTDNLLHVLEGVSARLTQLESRTRHLENSVDDLKVSVGNNHGTTDGKMIQLENILREVQTGVHGLKDKQEIMEAQLLLAKLQVSKADQLLSETQNSGQMDALQQAASIPLQSHQQLPPPMTFPQSIPPVSVAPPALPPPPIPQQSLPPPAPLLNQFPQNKIPSVPQGDSYYLPPGQTQEPPNPQYQAPLLQQPQPSSAVLTHQPYPPAPQPQYSQPPQPLQTKSSLGHLPEETPYIPSQSYPPHQPSPQSPSVAAPSQQHYRVPSQVYEPSSSRPSSGFAAGYGPPSGPTEPYPYGGSPSQYGSNLPMKQQPHSSPAKSQTGGSGYPQLPTARILPHALPTASGTGGGTGSSGTGNRVAIDDVVEKVANMGFPREHVRATVRKLTENGQSVDLNVVLDKLMNDGEVQPLRGWFGR